MTKINSVSSTVQTEESRRYPAKNGCVWQIYYVHGFFSMAWTFVIFLSAKERPIRHDLAYEQQHGEKMAALIWQLRARKKRTVLSCGIIFFRYCCYGSAFRLRSPYKSYRRTVTTEWTMTRVREWTSTSDWCLNKGHYCAVDRVVGREQVLAAAAWCFARAELTANW